MSSSNSVEQETDEVSQLRAEIQSLQKRCQESNAAQAALQSRNSELERNNERLRREAGSTQSAKHGRMFWYDLLAELQLFPDAVKARLLNGELDVHEVSHDEQTVLHLAAQCGAYEVAQLCLNLGADATRKDTTYDAIYWANYYKQHHVEQLLRFSTLKGNASEQMQGTAHHISKQNGIIENIMEQLSKYDEHSQQFLHDMLQSIIEQQIEHKLVFSDDLLTLCMSLECQKAANVLDTKIWHCIAKTCSDIIQSGSKLDWFWLKNVMLPSTIWYKNTNAKKKAKPSYLYYELLKLVEGQAKAALDALDTNLQELADQDNKAWQHLIEWDLPDNEYDVIRQDAIPNGITAKYTQQQLSVSSSSTFNAHSFYDYNEYLPQLVLLAQMVDHEFQQSVQRIFNFDKTELVANLNHETKEEKQEHVQAVGDGFVRYSRGPVKLIDRARSKAQSDYADQAYPTSACVLDLNRCSLIFNDISSMLKAIQLFVNKVKYYQSGCIIGIVRGKNGFKEYVKEAQYADIKLNVLIKGKAHCIIGEVQFLLNTMKRFKEKAHNLYSIQRQQEYYDEAVTPILPLLLDDEKQVGIASKLNDVKTMSRLMLFSNKQQEEILHMVDMQDVCERRYAEMLRFLEATISPDLLIKSLFDDVLNETLKTINIQETLRYFWSFAHIRERWLRDDRLLFCMVGILRRVGQNTHYYRERRIELIQCVRQILELDEARLTALQSFQYEKPAEISMESKAPKYWEHEWRITDDVICMILSSNKEDYPPLDLEK